METNDEIMPGCVAAADAISKGHPHPLGDKPVVDVRTTNEFRSQEYEKLQTDLLSLSRNSKELIAEKSGHFVIIDRPDVVIDGIRQAVQSARNNTMLYHTESAGFCPESLTLAGFSTPGRPRSR